MCFGFMDIKWHQDGQAKLLALHAPVASVGSPWAASLSDGLTKALGGEVLNAGRGSGTSIDQRFSNQFFSKNSSIYNSTNKHVVLFFR